MSAIAWGDIATWFSGCATAGALIFAAIQVRYLKRQADHDRDVAMRGVAMSWRSAPDPAAASRTQYRFLLVNPGRLPIKDVSTTLSFPVAVSYLDRDGVVQPAATTMVLDTPVVLGGDRREWVRTLVLGPEQRDELRRITCDINFRDVDGHPCTTSCGRHA